MSRARIGFSKAKDSVDREGRVSERAVSDLLDRALGSLASCQDAPSAIAKLFSPSDVVGIKVNCLAGRGLSTHRELVLALASALVKGGVRADRIIIWDRSDRDLVRAGFTVTRTGPGPFIYGTNDDYEKEPTEAGQVGGCLSRILTNKITALVNMPVLKDHDLAGISGALKNNFGVIHNPNKYHDHGCSPYVADLAAHPALRDKLRLTVFDALVGQCQGGPAYAPAYAWSLGAVFATLDPVLADAKALALIEQRRKEVGLPSLEAAGRQPLWLRQAADRGLGTLDLRNAEEVVR